MTTQDKARLMDRIKTLECDPAFDTVKGLLAGAADDVHYDRISHAGWLLGLASKDCPPLMPAWQRHQLVGVVYELDHCLTGRG